MQAVARTVDMFLGWKRVLLAVVKTKDAAKSNAGVLILLNGLHILPNFRNLDVVNKTITKTNIFMNKFFLSLLLSAAPFALHAQDNPLWLRHSAISPDGKSVAFAYHGDIFTVSADGGEARQLTSNVAFDSYPVWSPDGRSIAFASDREGSTDVWVVNAGGGVPRRLTTNSGNEYPLRFLNDSTVLFKAAVAPSAQGIVFAGGTFPQVWAVSTAGGRRPRLFSEITMDGLDINARGDVLYYDKKGYEDEFRKHHHSPIARDIWLRRGGRFTKLTTFDGEDRDPVWCADGNSFFYLSEQSGTMNVHRRSIDGGSDAQLTHFKNNPVRFLTSSADGKLCFGYDGEIYTLRPGGEPVRLNVRIAADNEGKDLIRQVQYQGATEIKLSPNGKEIGFVMHGDVYVTSIDYRTTRQITDTPEQERSIDFAPDGRSITYASERGGLWQVYVTTIHNKDEKQFAYATELDEQRLTESDHTSFQPKYSPSGKEIAFYEDRGTLRIIDVKSRKVRTVMDGRLVYSYSDGDIDFEWSPDSRWLLASYIGKGGWNNQDIALVDASGNTAVRNLTNSGYSDGDARWVLGGKAMLFSSDRAGYRSHGSWGAERDAYIMFFDLDAYDRFCMSKEERALLKDSDKKGKDNASDKKDGASDKKDDGKPKDVKPLKLDVDNCRDRVLRLTVNSSFLGNALLDNEGENLYYQASFEGSADLWRHNLVDNRTEIMVKGFSGGGMCADKDFKNIYLVAGGIRKVELASRSVKNVDFEATFNYRPYKEREYMFNHVWQQVKDKFYDTTLHGVDWEGYRKTYERFLPYINNNNDFQEMLSEMLGELNASHTGARYYGYGAPLQTACLGLLFDESYEGDGLRVAEVLRRGPFDVKDTGVGPGCIIEKIDGHEIKAGMDYFPLLDGKASKPVRLTVSGINGKKNADVVVKPITQGVQNTLLYKRWVDRNRALVDSLSGGRLAYVHVKAMNSESFRTVYDELLNEKNRNREAVIVDERHNGGGWLHDDLCTLLGGKQYQSFVPRGNYVGRDPYNKWVKPSCVMICEDDYSNGHGFPWVYKTLGIGKLVGTPVAGTMTAVWWETMIDRSMVFGIPQVGCVGMDGKYGENNQLNPDITVYNTPEDYISGHDRQLEAAVKEMLRQADAAK